MTTITMSGGKVVMRNGKIGTEQACCCGCPCGYELNASNVCVFCALVPTCGSGNITADWQGISLPDDAACAWATGGGGNPSYLLRLQPGDGISWPDVGVETVDGVCYMFGFVGASAGPADLVFEVGACRLSVVVWKWRLAWPSCAEMIPGGPYTPTLSFYSGYNQTWAGYGVPDEISSISSAGEACEPLGDPPVVTVSFPP